MRLAQRLMDWITEETTGDYYLPPLCAVCGLDDYDEETSTYPHMRHIDDELDLDLCQWCEARFNAVPAEGGAVAEKRGTNGEQLLTLDGPEQAF